MHFITNGYKRFSKTNSTDPGQHVPFKTSYNSHLTAWTCLILVLATLKLWHSQSSHLHFISFHLFWFWSQELSLKQEDKEGRFNLRCGRETLQIHYRGNPCYQVGTENNQKNPHWHQPIYLYHAVTILVMFLVSHDSNERCYSLPMAPDYYFVQPQFGYNELEWSKIKMTTPW